MDRGPDLETLVELKPFLAGLRKRFGPLRAVLFGSRARAAHLVTSDFDLLLVSDRFRGLSFRDRILETTREWDGPYRLDVLCYTADELALKQTHAGVVAEALRHGVELDPSS